jgi:SAM-dependent methyltransferase
MIKNNLISICTCGNDTNFSNYVKNNLDVLECLDCGVIHQRLENWTQEMYIGFYSHEYHLDYQKNRGTITYEERYDHDCCVSDLRLEAYKELLKPRTAGLDIGSSNSAFVHRAIDMGYKCVGLEPGERIGDNSVTIRGTLENADLSADAYDWATLHDSIEHMVDVNKAFEKLSLILKKGGLAILDLPDYFIPHGSHHWKRIEHLWLFSKDQFAEIIRSHGFSIEKITAPIPGKLVFYARKR